MTKPVQSLVSIKNPIGLTTNVSIPVIASTLSTEAATAWGPDRVKRFTPDAWQDQAEALDILSTDAIYLALAEMFGDHPRQLFKPAYCVVIRRDTPVAQAVTYTVGGNADGDYSHTINSAAPFVHTAAAETATQIRDALIALINAGSEPVTATPHADPEKYIVTADKAGIPFTYALSSPGDVLVVFATVASVGIYDDLEDAETEDRTGYMYTETSFDDDVCAELGRWVMAKASTRPVTAGFETLTSDVITGATTDVASKLKALNYWRVFALWHDSATQHVMAGWIGRCIAYPVGQVNWSHKQLTGVVAVDFTDPTLTAAPGYLEGKNVNRYDAIGLGSTLYGTMLDGRFIDQVLLKDLLDLGVTEYLLTFLQTADIITFDAEGIAQLQGALEVYLKQIADQGALDPESITITTVPAEDVPVSDQAVRNYSKLSWSAKARGAVNRLISVTGIVEV